MNDDAMAMCDSGRTTKSSGRLLSTVAIAVLIGTPVVLASDPVESTGEDLVIQRHEPDAESHFTILDARRPVIVEVSLDSESGAPSIPGDALDRIAIEAAENPERLLTIRFTGVPLRFAALPTTTRVELRTRGGSDIGNRYEMFLSAMIHGLLEEVDDSLPGTAMSIQGLPFEGGSEEVSESNRRYLAVVESLEALVMARTMFLSRDVDEKKMALRNYANAFDASEGRPILFPANRGWRIALDPDGLDASESEDFGAPAQDVGEGGGSIDSASPTGNKGGLESGDVGSDGSTRPSVGGIRGSTDEPENAPGGFGRPGNGAGFPTRPSGASPGEGSGVTSDPEPGWSPTDEVAEQLLSDHASPPGDSAATNPGDVVEDSIDRGPFPGVGEGPIEEWESHVILQSLIDATPDGGVLDISGRGFLVAPGEVVRVIEKSIRILGGHVTGAVELDWSPLGGGLFEAAVDLSGLNDLKVHLLDQGADSWPLLGQYPLPPPVRHFDRLTHNSNWWVVNDRNRDIDHGVVLTASGEDVIGSPIIGVRITDPAMRAAIDVGMSGEDPSSMSVMYHAGANVIATDRVTSWSPATGVLEFGGVRPLNYNKYLRFCLVGSPAFVRSPGEYAVDIANDRIVYRPVDGDPDGARLPMNDKLIRFYDADAEFVDSTFTGNLASQSGAGMLSSTGQTPSRIKMTGCHMHSCRLAVSSARVDIDRSVIEHSTDRGIAVVDGSRITRSVIRDIQNRGGVLVMSDGSDPDQEIEFTLVRDNYFNMPASAHGQGVSLYKDAWQNALIDHNIFVDCQRAFSFQPDTRETSRRSDVHSFVFSNNLIISCSPADTLAGGQSTLSFNGRADTHLPIGTTMTVDIVHNTVIVFADVIDDPTSYTMETIDVRRLVRSNVRVEGNFAGVINASVRDDEGWSDPHQRFGNLMLSDLHGSSYGEFDLRSPRSLDAVIDRESLEMRDYAMSAASDGGPVGIRWRSIPPVSSLFTLPIDWAADHPAEEPPPATQLGGVYFGEDRR